MVRSADALLSGVTRMLYIADIADALRLQASLKQVSNFSFHSLRALYLSTIRVTICSSETLISSSDSIIGGLGDAPPSFLISIYMLICSEWEEIWEGALKQRTNFQSSSGIVCQNSPPSFLHVHLSHSICCALC